MFSDLFFFKKRVEFPPGFARIARKMCRCVSGQAGAPHNGHTHFTTTTTTTPFYCYLFFLIFKKWNALQLVRVASEKNLKLEPLGVALLKKNSLTKWNIFLFPCWCSTNDYYYLLLGKSVCEMAQLMPTLLIDKR